MDKNFELIRPVNYGNIFLLFSLMIYKASKSVVYKEHDPLITLIVN